MKLYTVAQFSKAHPAFTQASLRNLKFKAETRQSTRGIVHGNGLIECGAIVRIGRKVLIAEDQFFEWVRLQNGHMDISTPVRAIMGTQPHTNKQGVLK